VAEGHGWEQGAEQGLGHGCSIADPNVGRFCVCFVKPAFWGWSESHNFVLYPGSLSCGNSRGAGNNIFIEVYVLATCTTREELCCENSGLSLPL
jgi:hypothetical protein